MLEKKTATGCCDHDYCAGWNDAVDAMSCWISVKEKLPDEGELVVFIPTINQGSIYVGKLSHTGARGGVLFENRQGRTTMKYYAKYWMPLPERPEEE